MTWIAISYHRLDPLFHYGLLDFFESCLFPPTFHLEKLKTYRTVHCFNEHPYPGQRIGLPFCVLGSDPKIPDPCDQTLPYFLSSVWICLVQRMASQTYTTILLELFREVSKMEGDSPLGLPSGREVSLCEWSQETPLWRKALSSALLPFLVAPFW